MEEEKILIYNEEHNYDTVVVEDTDEILYDETVQVVEVDEQELFTVRTNEAFAALGAQNPQLNHALLHNRDLPDQHTIPSITGLRAELDGIHALKTVESNKRGFANYYMWQDSDLPKDRVGYFVSIHTRDHKISIIRDSETEIFGVTVGSAGFVGWQQYNEDNRPRDDKYALVANTGVVRVRCGNKVVSGNYVMPSGQDGLARSTGSKYGYYVISIDIIDNQRYAIISLDSTMNQVYQLSEDVADVKKDLINVEIKTNAAINAATSAIKNTYESSINSALQNSQNALNNANSAMNSVKDFTDSIGSEVESIKAQVNAVDAQIITAAQEVVQKEIDKIIDEAVGASGSINEMQTQIAETRELVDDSFEEIQGLKKQIEPLVEFQNETSTTIAGIVAKTEDNTTELAAISNCFSNDYVTQETWISEYESEIGTIFYIEDTQTYRYFDFETEKWMETPYLSEAGLTETIASMRQKIDENEAMVENFASYAGRDYETVEVWNKYVVVDNFEPAIADTNLIYYDKKQYYQCDPSILEGDSWKIIDEPENFEPLTDAHIETIYYAQDKEFYCYYDEGWHTTEVLSVADLVESIALIKQLANKNESRIDNIVSFSGKDGEALALLQQKADDNESKISQLTSYIQNDYTKLETPWDKVDKTPGVIYYAQDPSDNTWKYWYYKEDILDWVGSVNPSDAGLVASLASVQQQADENGASITQLQAHYGEVDTAINELKSWVNDNGAGTESLVVYISKYTVGEYSQAHGLTVKAAQELLQDGSVFIPSKDVQESYDRLVKLDEDWNEEGKSPALIYGKNTNDVWHYWYYDEDNKVWTETDSINTYRHRSFFQYSSYIWDKTNGVWMHGGDNVGWALDYFRGDESMEYIVIGETYNCSVISINTRTDATDLENYTMYYAEDESQYYYYAEGEWFIAQDPNFEIGALYYWNTEEANPYWQKVARIDGNTLNRAISQVSQSVSDAEASFNAQISTTNGNLAGMQATVDAFGSTYVTKTVYEDKMTSIDQKSDENEARLRLLVSNGYETVSTWVEPEDTDTVGKTKVFYAEDTGRYHYWNDGWTSTDDINDENIASKIHSAGIIASINDADSNLKISANHIDIEGSEIDLEGYVKFTDLEGKGTTTINGSNITTGTIDANRLNVGRDANIRHNLITAGDFYDPNGGSGWEKDENNPPDGITNEYSATYKVEPVVGQNYMRILVGESEAQYPNIINKYLIPVVGGQTYTASYYCLRQSNEDTRHCRLSIDWFRANGTQHSKETIDADNYDTDWHRYSKVLTCPNEATQVRIRFFVESNSNYVEGTTHKFNEYFIWICGVMLSKGEELYDWDGGGGDKSNVIIDPNGVDIYNGMLFFYNDVDESIGSIDVGRMYNNRPHFGLVAEYGTSGIVFGARGVNNGVGVLATLYHPDALLDKPTFEVQGDMGVIGKITTNGITANGNITVPNHSLTVGSGTVKVEIAGGGITTTHSINVPNSSVTVGSDEVKVTISGGGIVATHDIVSNETIRAKKNLWADYEIYAQNGSIHVASVETIKTNISTAPSILDKIQNTGVYSYNYISDTQSGDDVGENGGLILNSTELELESPKTYYGLVIGEGYNTPSEVISKDGEHIDLYSMISLGWKGIQELVDINNNLATQITALEERIEALETQNTTEE